MMGRFTLAVAGLAILTVCSSVRYAEAGKCSSGEAKAIGKKVGCKAGVFAKAASKGLTPDAAKLTGCEMKFSGAFAKAQSAGDCEAPTYSAATAETKVDNLVNDLNAEIHVTPASKCQAAKLKAAGKKASCLLGVDAKGLAKPPIDMAKHDACKAKFAAAFAKAAGGTTCGTSANQTTIENKVDAFEADIQDDVHPPPTTTTVTTTTMGSTTTTNPHVCGNGVVEGPAETCDDGNTVDENTVDPLPPDACPANCRIESCNSTTQMMSVSVNFSSSASIAGYKVFVDYPESKVIIPGVGQPAAGVITNDPTNGAVGNDLDYGIIVVGSQINAIPPPRLFTLNFTSCGSTPTAAEFRCKVHQASDTNGNDAPMTCSVSIP